MEFIITIPWFLPSYKAGGPIQSIATQLLHTDKEIQYKLVCSNKDLDGTILDVPTNQWVNFNAWTKVWYSSNGKHKKLFNDRNAVLFINGIYSWNYNLKLILLAKASRKIVSVRGMLHPGALSQKPFKKKLFLKTWKFLGLHRRVEFHASAEEEKGYIKAVFGKAVKVHVAANFPRIFQKQSVSEKQKGCLNLMSVALISPMKNHLLVLQALAELATIEKEGLIINYHIYGPVKEQKYWQECLLVIKEFPSTVQAHFHGDIEPWKVEQALETGHVFILPSKSENFGHAIYEALSAGKPVITSTTTPWNGLKEAKAGINVSTEVRDLSDAIAFFAAMEQEELEEWSAGAKAYSKRAIDLEKIKQQYRVMFGIES